MTPDPIDETTTPTMNDAADVPLLHDVPAPNDLVRAELEAYLEQDHTALGDVWRRTNAGETPDEIRQARGTERSTFVWSYLRVARALVEGSLPSAPTVALQTARTFRRILKEAELSNEARAMLEERLQVLEARAADPGARQVEERKAREATADAEEHAVPGIYVYSLPHYIRYPYDEDSGRTLLKVGRADRSVIRRFREQVRTTALPEDPVLLRVYETGAADTSEKEKVFHRLLEAADHDRSKARTGGTEWFLTSLRFLDEVALVLGLAVRDVPGFNSTD